MSQARPRQRGGPGEREGQGPPGNTAVAAGPEDLVGRLDAMVAPAPGSRRGGRGGWGPRR